MATHANSIPVSAAALPVGLAAKFSERASARTIASLIERCLEAERARGPADAALDDATTRYRAFGVDPAPDRKNEADWDNWLRRETEKEEAAGLPEAEALSNEAYDLWVSSMAAIAAARAVDLGAIAAKARLVLAWFEDPEVWRSIEGFEADKVKVALSALRDVGGLIGIREPLQ